MRALARGSWKSSVNPQGQFLFVEGMSDMKLAAACSDFLYRAALEHRGH